MELAGVLLLLLQEGEVQAEDVAVPPLSVRARPVDSRWLSKVCLGPIPGLSSRICFQTLEISSMLTSRSATTDVAG